MVKIPNHPTGAYIRVTTVDGHSLAAVVVNNASKVVLIFNDIRLNCTNVAGNLWVLAQHAIPIDWLIYNNIKLTTDGVAKELLYISRKQHLEHKRYTTELLTPNSQKGGTLGLIFGTLTPRYTDDDKYTTELLTPNNQNGGTLVPHYIDDRK